MFPLEVGNVDHLTLFVNSSAKESNIWQLRYGLNIKGLKTLSQRGMVKGLPHVEQFGIPEGCVLGKQTR